MPVITRINGIPLFSSIQGALRWARFNRLKGGYHVHYWEGRKGYMGGNNHSEVAKRRPMKIDPVLAAKYKANKILPPTVSEQPVQLVDLEKQKRLRELEELERRERRERPTIDRITSSDSGY